MPIVEFSAKRASVSPARGVVGEDDRAAQVAGEILHPVAQRLRHSVAISLRDRQDHVAVDRLVEVEDRTVQVLVRVVEILLARDRRGLIGGSAPRQDQQCGDAQARAGQPQREKNHRSVLHHSRIPGRWRYLPPIRSFGKRRLP